MNIKNYECLGTEHVAYLLLTFQLSAPALWDFGEHQPDLSEPCPVMSQENYVEVSQSGPTRWFESSATNGPAPHLCSFCCSWPASPTPQQLDSCWPIYRIPDFITSSSRVFPELSRPAKLCRCVIRCRWPLIFLRISNHQNHPTTLG